MDKRIVYAGQIPYESDILFSNRFATVGVGQLAGAVLGTGTWLKGFGYNVTKNSTPFVVEIAPGQIYVDSVVDDSAYSSLPADATVIKQQGLLTAAQSFTMARPSNNAKYYVIEARFDFVDEDNAALVYYNASDPSSPFVGPGNAGTTQPTIRRGKCVLSLLAGGEAAAPTIPTVSDGAVALYTVYLTSTTSSIAASPVANATTEGIYDFAQQNGHFINIGGTGNLTSSTADNLYGRKGSANTWSGVQTVSVANATPVILTGGTAAGTGISITGNGSTNPKKTVRVKDGNFQVLANDDTAIPLSLTDAGALTVLGKVVAASPTDENDTTALATVAFTEGRYAVSGSYITQTAADSRYLRLTGQGITSGQTIYRAPVLELSQVTGSNPNGLAGNELITVDWAEGTFATSAAAGMQQSAADGRYLRTGLGAATAASVSGVITFGNQVKFSTDTDGAQTTAAVNVAYLNSNYKKTNEAGTFTKLTLSDATNTPTGAEAARADYIAANYASKGATTYTTGSHNFSGNGVSVLVGTPTQDTQAANKAFVDAAISGVNSTISGFASNATAETIGGAWSFTSGITIAGTSTISGAQGTSDNNIVMYGTVKNRADKSDNSTQTFTGKIQSGDDSTVDADVVRHGQVFGSSSALAQLGSANVFTDSNKFRSGISLEASANNTASKIDFGGIYNNSEIEYDPNNGHPGLWLRPGAGAASIGIKDDSTILSVGALSQVGDIGVVGAVSATAGAPAPTSSQPALGDQHLIRRLDFKPSFRTVDTTYRGTGPGARDGYVVLPNGQKFAWGIINIFTSSSGPAVNNTNFRSIWVDLNLISGIPSADRIHFVHNVQVTVDGISHGLPVAAASNRNHEHGSGATKMFAIQTMSFSTSGVAHYYFVVGV
ncbi:MAG: hypothetical protein P8N94_15600 [Gammaproteobacteria bacterium]|nr:hypothetical protein [Gammaproteobacteria bacterium]